MKAIVRAIVIVMVPFLVSDLALAEIYRWTDEKGTVHFTDDPATIPEKYREKVKSRQTEEDRMTLEERIEQKMEQENRIKREQEQSNERYNRSIAEEQEKRRKRDLEDRAYENQLAKEKDDKARRVIEEKERQRKEQEPVYETIACSACGGTGTIWKKMRVAEKSGYSGPAHWKTEQVATKCEFCNGKGHTLKRIK